jgi:hypothetical protein
VNPAAPPRSLEQRHQALDRANAIRTRRAEFKHDLAAGTVSILDVLDDPPEWLRSAKVAQILLAVPGLGPVKVGSVLKRAECSGVKTFGGLSSRQRVELRLALRARRVR